MTEGRVGHDATPSGISAFFPDGGGKKEVPSGKTGCFSGRNL